MTPTQTESPRQSARACKHYEQGLCRAQESAHACLHNLPIASMLQLNCYDFTLKKKLNG